MLENFVPLFRHVTCGFGGLYAVHSDISNTLQVLVFVGLTSTGAIRSATSPVPSAQWARDGWPPSVGYS
jgi:hypothetical protein